ncbi:hypothetical protein [Amycolatopsis sp. H20-H5]|nr:hypothetical protein [Amycolatopsis sp. H20-H5]MEC3982394.1 hypothetical protein [Amycolatopsis sp. H20-H5]
MSANLSVLGSALVGDLIRGVCAAERDDYSWRDPHEYLVCGRWLA